MGLDDLVGFVVDAVKESVSWLNDYYKQLADDLDVAKVVVQKKDSSVKIEVKTDRCGNLVLVHRLFEGHGYQPVSIDYSNERQFNHYSFAPPYNSKRMKSDLPIDYRVERHKNGSSTVKVSKKHLGRAELDLQEDASVSGYRLYTGWGAKFYDSTHSKRTRSSKK